MIGSRFNRFVRYGAVLVVAVLLAGTAFGPITVSGGQGTLGTLTGVVQDATKAILPGVTVKVVNEDTGLSQSTLSNDSGFYRFLLPPGKNYTISADFTGFKKIQVKNITVRAADEQTVNLAMEIGDLSQTITVSADKNPMMNELSQHIGTLVNQNQLQNLPMMGADPIQLMTTLPGYRASPLGHEYDSVGGLPMYMANTVRDGLSVTDAMFPNGVSSGTPLRPDMISENRLILSPVMAAATIVPSDPRTMAALDGRPNEVPPMPPPNTEAYDRISDNPFVTVRQAPLATFSSDVDTASYANVRRFLNRSQAPPRDAVRIEEMINYFTYDYPKASGPHPIAANIEVAAAPWSASHRLVRIGIKAKEVQLGQKATNLVFLVDVSGSMATPEKLPLLKSALRMVVDRLTEKDRITIVTYAGSTGVALRPTSGDRKDVILQAIDALGAGGGTNGAAGIQLAYENAVYNFVEGGVNRVILATDGDFNVGITNRNDLTTLIEDKARSGVFLTALGFGMGNYKDSTLETLADKGNGNYAYIDSLSEARKALVEQLTGTLVTVAKDVKIQVEFNPDQVSAYRLIGYENRVLRAQDFADDRKDAGDMGAGHTVTALFEVVLQGVDDNVFAADGLRYQESAKPAPVKNDAKKDRSTSRELLNLRVRYKEPEGTESKLIEFPTRDNGTEFLKASSDFRFAAAVASFGMILRNSPHRGAASMENVIRTAIDSKGADRQGYREEFIRLAEQAARLGLR